MFNSSAAIFALAKLLDFEVPTLYVQAAFFVVAIALFGLTEFYKVKITAKILVLEFAALLGCLAVWWL